MIDFGISVQKLRRWLETLEMELSDLTAVLLTHEHIDHVKGVKTFVKRYGVPIYATHGTAEALYRTIPGIDGRITEYYGDAAFSIGNVKVESLMTPHDAQESVGFVFRADGLHFGYATDLGFVPSTIQKRMSGCVTALIESNHDIRLLETGPYPYYLKQRVRGARGHLSNDDCACWAATLAKTGTKRFVLAHLSETNNRPGLAKTCCLEAVHTENPNCEVLVLPADGCTTPIDLT